MRKLISQDKDKEFAYKLLSQAEQTNFGENWFYLLPVKIDLGSENHRHTLKQHLPSPLPHPQLHTLIHDSSTPCPKWQGGWGYSLYLQTLPPHTFPLLQCGLSMGCSSFKEISICSSMGSSRGCNTDICSSAWSTTFFSPPLPFHPSLTVIVLSAVSNYYFPPHTSGIF